MRGIDNVINIKCEALMPCFTEILDNGGNVKFSVTGDSMYPFLRPSIDSVVISGVKYSEIRLCDIVLIRRKTGQYVLHRLIKKNNSSFYIAGDAQNSIEGPLYSEQIYGCVITVCRKNKEISCSNVIWNIISFLWLLLFPFRCLIIRLYKKLRASVLWRSCFG